MSEHNIEEESIDNLEDTGLNKGEEDKPERDSKGRLLPGSTANLNGRPKGKGLNLTSLLKKKLEEVPKDQEKTYKEVFIEALLKKALIDGDLQAMKLIMNYIDGMPSQKIVGTISNINIDYEHLSEKELKDRIGEYLERIGTENEEEGSS